VIIAATVFDGVRRWLGVGKAADVRQRRRRVATVGVVSVVVRRLTAAMEDGDGGRDGQ